VTPRHGANENALFSLRTKQSSIKQSGAPFSAIHYLAGHTSPLARLIRAMNTPFPSADPMGAAPRRYSGKYTPGRQRAPVETLVAMELRRARAGAPRDVRPGTSGPETPKAAWVSLGGLRGHQEDVRNHRLRGPPSTFPGLRVTDGAMAKKPCVSNELLRRTGQTKAGVFIDHMAFGLGVRVQFMTSPE
jgi:hypothetical protein